MYLYEIIKGVMGFIFISSITYIYYPQQNNVIKNNLLHNYIKGYGIIEKYTMQYYNIIKIKIKKPILKIYNRHQFDLLFVHDGAENDKYLKNNFNNIRKLIKPYDFIVNIFHIEKDNDIIPYIQVLEIYSKTQAPPPQAFPTDPLTPVSARVANSCILRICLQHVEQVCTVASFSSCVLILMNF